MNRSYGQYCGLAFALDLVGQRWALLVVRDLVPGPRRFTDLFAGLPGIATDVLADRLRALEAAGVVRQRAIRHPVPANVYELTESGRELASVAQQLAGWGQRLMPAPGSAEARVSPRWALQSMTAAYSGGAPEGRFELVVDDEELCVVVVGDEARVEYGPAVGPSVASVRCSARQFFSLVREPARCSRPPRGVEIAGDRDGARALFASMPLRLGSTR